MRCPECGYESLFTNAELFSRSHPCIACGYDANGVEFYNEASADFIEVKEWQLEKR